MVVGAPSAGNGEVYNCDPNNPEDCSQISFPCPKLNIQDPGWAYDESDKMLGLSIASAGNGNKRHFKRNMTRVRSRNPTQTTNDSEYKN